MSVELRQDPISEADGLKVEAHILRLRTATEREIQAVLHDGDLREGTSTKFIMERFLETRTLVRGEVQRLFEAGGQSGDLISKTIKDIYFRPSHFKAPQLADFAVHSDLGTYSAKRSDKFTIMTAKNVVMAREEKEIKTMHEKFHAKTEGLKGNKKRAVAQALTNQYLGLEIATLATRLELKEAEIFSIMEDLNMNDLKPEGLSIAVRNGIAILTTFRDDGKIYLLDTPEARKHLLAKPTPPPQSKIDHPGRKNRKKGERRSKTIALKRLTKGEIQEGVKLIDVDTRRDRPKNRGDCIDGPRPCPFVACKHHLYLEVNPDTGSIKLNFPDTPVWEMKESCSLDIADRGGITLEETGDVLNLTRERIRQMEILGLEAVRISDEGKDLMAGGLHEDTTEGYDLLGLSSPKVKRRKKVPSS